MGYLQEGGILIPCDSVLEVTAGIAANDLTIVITQPVVDSTNNVVKGTLTFTKGGANSFTKTEAAYAEEFASAIADAGGVSAGSIELPTVDEEVTATGAFVGSITPTYAVAFAAI